MARLPDRSEPGNETPESRLGSGWTISDQGAQAPEKTRPSNRQQTAIPEQQSVRPELQVSADSPKISNLQLVLFGVFGGLYLLYTAGWFFIAQYFAAANALAASTSGIVGGVLQQALFWASAVAPALWFGASILLARHRKSWFLPVALFLGAIVLLPLPLFVVGGS